MAQSKANQERAERARHALDSLSDGVTEESITDLLTNIRHLCVSEGADFGTLDQMAEIHFEAEGGHLPWSADEILI